MAFYRTRPVVVEAWCNADGGPPAPGWVDLLVGGRTRPGGVLLLATGGGLVQVDLGAWLVREHGGAVFAVPPDAFAARYELVAGDPGGEDP